MSLFSRIKSLFKQDTKKAKQTTKKAKQTTKSKPTTKKENKLISGFKNLFKPRKKAKPTTKVTPKTEFKDVRKHSKDTNHTLYNNAKQAKYELISDMSVRVRLETSKGVHYRHWGIFGKEKIVSNYEVYETIDNDIYENNTLNFIFTTSGVNFEIYNYSIVATYRNFDER